jgi:hypothetical protein
VLDRLWGNIGQRCLGQEFSQLAGNSHFSLLRRRGTKSTAGLANLSSIAEMPSTCTAMTGRTGYVSFSLRHSDLAPPPKMRRRSACVTRYANHPANREPCTTAGSPKDSTRQFTIPSDMVSRCERRGKNQ